MGVGRGRRVVGARRDGSLCEGHRRYMPTKAEYQHRSRQVSEMTEAVAVLDWAHQSHRQPGLRPITVAEEEKEPAMLNSEHHEGASERMKGSWA